MSGASQVEDSWRGVMKDDESSPIKAQKNLPAYGKGKKIHEDYLMLLPEGC